MDTSDKTREGIAIGDIIAFGIYSGLLVLLWCLIQKGFIHLSPWLVVWGPLLLAGAFLFVHLVLRFVLSRNYRFQLISVIPMSMLTLFFTGISLVGGYSVFDVNTILQKLINEGDFQKTADLISNANYSQYFPDGSTLLTMATRKEGELLNGDPSKLAVSEWFKSMLNTGRSSLRLHEEGSGLDVLAYSLSNPILFEHVAAAYNHNPQHGHPADGDDYPAKRNLYHVALDCGFIEIENLGKTVEKIGKCFQLKTSKEDAYKQTPLDILLTNQRHRQKIAERSWKSSDSPYNVAIESLLGGETREWATSILMKHINTNQPVVPGESNFWVDNLNYFISRINLLPAPQR